MQQASRRSVVLALRTPQAKYLAGRARLTEVALSDIVNDVIANARLTMAPPPESRSPQQRRVHLWMDCENIVFIDELARTWGLSRSDVARRLIDQARST